MFRLGHLALLLAAGSTALLAELPYDRPTGKVVEDAPQVVRFNHRGKPILDNAHLRDVAMRAWWGEWSPEFRSFMQETAAAERGRFASQMPKSGGHEMMLAAPANGNWVNIGPTRADIITNGGTNLAKTDSGRPRSIVIDPTNNQVIYLCTGGGGVWKTTNGGGAWTPITDTLGTLSNGFLAIDPANTQTLYLGLGDPFDGTGIGLVKSTDGGTTWSAPIILGASRSVRSILVHPTNSNIVMVSTDAGLYRSTDAGVTYAQIATVPATWKCWDIVWAGGSNFVISVQTDPANANGYVGGKIYRSTDDGATWASAAGAIHGQKTTRISIAAAPSNRSTLYAMAAFADDVSAAGDQDLQGVYKSTDGGANWAAVTNPGADFLGGQGYYNHAILVDRANPSIIYVGGQLAMKKSTNGGTSWAVMTDWLAQNNKPYVHADFHCGAQDSAGNLFMGTDGGIFKSTDAGTTFTDALNVGITSHLIYSVGSSPAAPNAVIGGFQDNGTRVRNAATSTFNQPVGGDGFGSVIHQVNGSNMLGSLYYSRIYKSTNGGATFASSSTGITESNNPNSAPFITRIELGPADATGNTVFTFSNTKVYKSTNFATSWAAMGTTGLPTATFYIRNVSASKSNANAVGLVANQGRVYLTSNGGTNWVAGAALPNSGSYTSSIAFDPTDHNTVYVTSVATDATKAHIWKSSNFGGSWAAIDGNGLPAGVPVNIVRVDPSDRNILYAGTHLGLYRSADQGQSWARWGNGLPLVNVMDLYVSPDGNLVRVATYGRGIWELRAGAVAPTITTQPANQTVTVGQTATFSVVASGTAPFNYQWYRGGAAIAGATAASYSTPVTVAGDNGATFYVTVSNAVGNVNSGNATLTVNAAVDTTLPTTTASVVGSSGTITLNATANDNIGVTKVEFYVDGTLKGNDTTSPYSMTLDSTTLVDGAHTLVTKAYDAAGNIGTSTAVNFNVSNAQVFDSGLVLNGSFESGSANWTGTTAVIGTFAAIPAFEGVQNALFAGKGVTTTQDLYQAIAIPAGVASATMTFQLRITTAETTTVSQYDKLTVQVRNTAGTVLATLATYSNLNKNAAYELKTLDLTPYAGQTVQLYFKATEDSSLQTSFAIDAVKVATSGAPAPDITAPTATATVTGTKGIITLGATVNDNVGVTKVEWLLDGVLKGTDLTSPFSMTLDSTTIADGAHRLVVKAYDAAGNVGTSTTLNFAVDNSVPASQDLILNGGFESGATNWAGTTGAIGTFTGQVAYEGTKYAWLCGNGTAGTEAIYQDVTIPAGATTATFTFYLHIDTAETTTNKQYDKLTVTVKNTAGTTLGTLATYSNLNKAAGYAQKSFDLSAYKGQTVRVHFSGTEDSSLQTSFVLDKVALVTQ